MSPALGKDEAMLWQAVPPCCALGAVRAGYNQSGQVAGATRPFCRVGSDEA